MGKQVKIWYNPDHPGIAVLESGLRQSDYLMFAFGLAVVLIGGFLSARVVGPATGQEVSSQAQRSTTPLILTELPTAQRLNLPSRARSSATRNSVVRRAGASVFLREPLAKAANGESASKALRLFHLGTQPKRLPKRKGHLRRRQTTKELDGLSRRRCVRLARVLYKRKGHLRRRQTRKNSTDLAPAGASVLREFSKSVSVYEWQRRYKPPTRASLRFRGVQARTTAAADRSMDPAETSVALLLSVRC